MGDFAFNEEQAIARLLRFLAVEGVTGQEKAIGQEVIAALLQAGVPRTAMHLDSAAERITLPTQTGNLIVQMPGTRPGPRRMFSAHLDTVPTCAGAQPKRQGKRIVSTTETALGGDDRTGVGVLATLAATLLERQLPHPPLTLLFTVREESGLHGARHVDLEALGDPVECFNCDGRMPQQLTIGAVGAERWEVHITGKASHAGVYPERGISATMVGALGLAEIHRAGLFGKIDNGWTGTANVGIFGGPDGKCAGQATNVVTDFAYLKGECRSHAPAALKHFITSYKKAFQEAARKVCDERGRPARVKFTSWREYHAFKVKKSDLAVKHAQQACASVGLTPELRISNGGLDANWLVRHGIPTVSFGAGQNNIHSIGEYVELDDYLNGCRFALALATQP